FLARLDILLESLQKLLVLRETEVAVERDQVVLRIHAREYRPQGRNSCLELVELVADKIPIKIAAIMHGSLGVIAPLRLLAAAAFIAIYVHGTNLSVSIGSNSAIHHIKSRAEAMSALGQKQTFAVCNRPWSASPPKAHIERHD